MHNTPNDIKTMKEPRCGVYQGKQKSNAVQARGSFTLIMGYELCSLLKNKLWLWNVE